MEVDFAATLILGFVTDGKLANAQAHALKIYFIKKGEFQQNVRVTIKGRHLKEDVDPSELLGK